MAYCGPRGIALHEFLTWPEESQEAALAWQAHEAKRCRNCGTHKADWIGPNGRPNIAAHWTEEVCPGCQYLGSEQDRLAADKDAPRGVSLVRHDGHRLKCPTCSQIPPSES